ncbi:MAG: hypothetical protein KAI90_08925 [Desulfobulbaceae bacterium]|nr:hypothetical protein [Desulfobulbaceae bacterium]
MYGSFNNIDHDWLVKMLEQRIDDSAMIGLIRKWLKAGVLEDGSKVIHPITGTPQGGVISPIPVNIYLHFVMVHSANVKGGCRTTPMQGMGTGIIAMI